MPETPTAVDVARAIADVMERRRVPYAIGGALALGFYAPLRATVDVYVNLFIPPAEGFGAITKENERLAALDEIEKDIDTRP